MAESRSGALIENISGEIIGANITGSGYAIGKDISISETIRINERQFMKIPIEYARAFKNFLNHTIQQIKIHNISTIRLFSLQQSIKELAKETEGVKPNQEPRILTKTELRSKFVYVAKNVLRVIPKIRVYSSKLNIERITYWKQFSRMSKQ
jgi:hypothetical protein